MCLYVAYIFHIRQDTDNLGLALLRRNPLHLSLPRSLLALALHFPRRSLNLCLDLWYTKLSWNHNAPLLSHRSSLVRRPIRLSSPSRKLQHARLCSRAGPCRRSAWDTYISERLQSFASCLWRFPFAAWCILVLLFLFRGKIFAERSIYPRILRVMAMVFNDVFETSLEDRSAGRAYIFRLCIFNILQEFGEG